LGRPRITDPLEGGLASRVYLAAFPCFRSCYQIAKMVVSGSAVNSSGRILKLALKFDGHFDIKDERVTMHRVRTLIMSKAEPFISKLATECQLSPDEVEALKSFVPNFRKIMGAYVDLTLRRKPDYLKHEVKAFEELLNALCLTLYIARLCSHASPQATDFSLSMLGVTLPVVLGTGGLCNEEILHFTRNLANITSQKTLTDMYIKVRKAISPQYEMVMTMLEGFEKYYKELEKHVMKRN
jgi:hypothetical protein